MIIKRGKRFKDVIYFETYPKRNKLPVKIPPRGDFTPDAWFTAVLVKEPVTGIERTKDPIMLQIPSANISCVTSKDLPIAVGDNFINRSPENKNPFTFYKYFKDLYAHKLFIPAEGEENLIIICFNDKKIIISYLFHRMNYLWI